MSYHGAMSQLKATICVLASGVLWGCISLFVRHLSASGLSSMDIVAVRMIVGAAGMLAVILATDRSALKVRARDLWLFAGTGIVSITLFNVCYFTCITLSEASIAVVLLYTSPMFVMAMSAIVFKERLNARKAAAVVMTLTGCALVAGAFGGTVSLTPLALAAGVASGFFYATYSIFGRVALERYGTLTITFYTFVAGAAASAIAGDVGNVVARAADDPQLLAWYAGLGVLCTIVPYLLYTAGLKRLEPTRAAIFATVEPLTGSLLGIFAYGEDAGPHKLAGMALILLAVALASGGASGNGTNRQ